MAATPKVNEDWYFANESKDDARYCSLAECDNWVCSVRKAIQKIKASSTPIRERDIFESILSKLREIEHRLMGRMAELDENYCTEHESKYYFSTIFKEYAELARDSGVNFVAVWRICAIRHMKDVINYLKDSGQASMNYDKTLQAVTQWYAMHEQQSI